MTSKANSLVEKAHLQSKFGSWVHDSGVRLANQKKGGYSLAEDWFYFGSRSMIAMCYVPWTKNTHHVSRTWSPRHSPCWLIGSEFREKTSVKIGPNCLFWNPDFPSTAMLPRNHAKNVTKIWAENFAIPHVDEIGLKTKDSWHLAHIFALARLFSMAHALWPEVPHRTMASPLTGTIRFSHRVEVRLFMEMIYYTPSIQNHVMMPGT